MESQGISKAGQTVLDRLMESQIWYLPAISVALLGEGSEKGQWPLPTFLSGTKLFPSSYLDARHFSSSFMPLVHFKLLPWSWRSEGMRLSLSPCVGSLRAVLGTPEVSSTDSIPADRCRLKLWGLIFLSLEPWAEGPGVRLGLLAPRYPSQIFIHQTM